MIFQHTQKEAHMSAILSGLLMPFGAWKIAELFLGIAAHCFKFSTFGGAK